MPKEKVSLEVQQLEALAAVPGAFKIITAERSGTTDDLTNPAAFVLHDVVRIEGPNHRGQYTAFSAEGDWTIGQPEALLVRLQEWRR